METIGQRLRRLREGSYVTRDALAHKTNLAISTLQKIESDGMRVLDTFALAEISKALNVDLHYVVFGVKHD